jgi:hypothetical protein
MTKKSKSGGYDAEVRDAVKSFKPLSLTGEGRAPAAGDHVENVVQLVEWGWSRLAADHLLFPELEGMLIEQVAGVLRQLNYRFALAGLKGGGSKEKRLEKIKTRYYSYEFLIELGLNYVGLESRWLDGREKEVCLEFIFETLAGWEMIEVEEHGVSAIALSAVDRLLDGMELVQGGASMVSLTAKRIRGSIKGETPVTLEFLDAAEEEITGNIYFNMVSGGVCKFGNDYALGLRWLRHLGFEQVSTNPVLAAKAYDDDPTLAETFLDGVVCHPMYEIWRGDPAKYADEITLYATLLALWDNLHVYRPIFYNLRAETGGGVVSFQLNPNLAHLAKESIADALTALKLAEENLRVYDSYLLAGYSPCIEKARANLVIKVAASHPAARKIAGTINSFGLGSNVTVVYTVGQQVTMILEEMAGMAVAIRKGILPTQLYMTNMGGRFESHLREVKLEGLFAKLKRKTGEKKARAKLDALAKANGSIEKVRAAANYEAAVVAATRFGVQKVIDDNVVKVLADVAGREELMTWESDIEKSGTLVARRVWGLFFSERNREKWVEYLCGTFNLDEDQARFIMSRINYLPASKRKPRDTYWTLTASNMVHTEFGNHQENVRKMSLEEGFELSDYIESIRDVFPPEVARRLGAIPDFVKGYELNAELNAVMKHVGIEEDFGGRGHKPSEWGEYGSVRKTLAEFKAAYDGFRKRIMDIFPG